MAESVYLCIDLKSFYASVECIGRGLDPMTTNLVVADESRTEKTICLAVSPSLKAYGLPGRARLFEVIAKVDEINRRRQALAKNRELKGKSYDATVLERDTSLALDYIVAPPQMAHYIQCSTQIYQVYLKYIAPEDIHVYSIDEVFMDVTRYLKIKGCTPRELAAQILADVLATTGITATAGIGTNLYLAKVAMDIMAKHVPRERNGGHIAELDELSYRKLLWTHQPLTDFWRVGHGYEKRLKGAGLYTMGDIARCSLGKATDFANPELLYSMFGVNAELLIDHAWGRESCTMADIKGYQPKENSLGSGQVLTKPYSCEKTRMVVWEMTELLVLDLVEKGLLTNRLTLTIGYDRINFQDGEIRKKYKTKTSTDPYGRVSPKQATGTARLPHHTSSTKEIVAAMLELYDAITDPALLVRRITIAACGVLPETRLQESGYQQMDFLTDDTEKAKEEQAQKKERSLQEAMIEIKKRHGKNAVLKGKNLEKDATTRDRNQQIGGHKA